jgi:hypothetical protein
VFQALQDAPACGTWLELQQGVVERAEFCFYGNPKGVNLLLELVKEGGLVHGVACRRNSHKGGRWRNLES